MPALCSYDGEEVMVIHPGRTIGDDIDKRPDLFPRLPPGGSTASDTYTNFTISALPRLYI
jgi:hypothetical protein